MIVPRNHNDEASLNEKFNKIWDKEHDELTKLYNDLSKTEPGQHRYEILHLLISQTMRKYNAKRHRIMWWYKHSWWIKLTLLIIVFFVLIFCSKFR